MVASLKLRKLRNHSAALDSPVRVMQTASEGGAWGIAVLARYMIETKTSNLATYWGE